MFQIPVPTQAGGARLSSRPGRPERGTEAAALPGETLLLHF
ncbi:hypothetical protein ACIBCA_00220 [Kitasatospora sp. NPDC051170]